MEVVPYREAHYFKYLAQLIPQPLGPLRGLQRNIKKDDVIWTCLKGEHILGIGGVNKLWEGVGEAWVLLDPAARRHPVTVYRVAAKYLAQAKSDFWRIQATVKSDFREGVRFALSLGFSLNNPEGKPMRGYGIDGGDYYMLEMIGVDPWV